MAASQQDTEVLHYAERWVQTSGQRRPRPLPGIVVPIQDERFVNWRHPIEPPIRRVGWR
jgi:hypothetical protein